ncbi:glycosyl transferase family 2 [Fulvimarina endophytica]|uniref:Glycosyl transferase family 2 n=1 Tax=Fulvimarina endophytica TaxID=2293836 RepID=A0A371X241_9HYPH|nr:glycosyl transferase family 2 [Fulvimarina endophytica]RFC63298.1 glycosyl transferase family 2 [Fulvimarina endophytica]
MLTVYMDCGAEERLLALTLAELVSGAVEGIVRTVVLIDRGMSEGAHRIAEHSGCVVIQPSALETAIGRDRSDWLLWLEIGSRPLQGWTSEVLEHLQGASGRKGTGPARFRPAARDRMGFLSRLTSRPSALETGLLLKKPQALGRVKQLGGEPLAQLASGLASRPLNAEIRPRRAAE